MVIVYDVLVIIKYNIGFCLVQEPEKFYRKTSPIEEKNIFDETKKLAVIYLK